MKRGRPHSEGTPRNVLIKVYVTQDIVDDIDKERGKTTRSTWIMELLKRRLR